MIKIQSLNLDFNDENENESFLSNKYIKKSNKQNEPKISLPKVNVNISHELAVQEILDFSSEKEKETNSLLEKNNTFNNIIISNKNNDNILSNEEDNSFEEKDIEDVDKIDENEQLNFLAAYGLANFFSSIKKFKVLSREEEKKYFLEYQKTKSEETRNFIICSNIKLVIAVAKKVSKMNNKMPLEDMIDEGVLGLVKAIDKFEPSRNLKFSTYAFQWIKQSITRSIANTGDIIRIPVHFTDNLSKIKRFENEYRIEKNTDSVPIEEISKALNIPIKKIKQYKKCSQAVNSIDIEIDENNTTISDLIQDNDSFNPEKIIVNDNLHDSLMEAIKTLNSREAFVIINKYNLDRSKRPLTIGEIAQKYNLTKERIRQIESVALEKLKHPSRCMKYKMFY